MKEEKKSSSQEWSILKVQLWVKSIITFIWRSKEDYDLRNRRNINTFSDSNVNAFI